MSQPGSQEIEKLIAPALQVLWAIKVGVQDHPCQFAPQVGKALDGLIQLQDLTRKAHHG